MHKAVNVTYETYFTTDKKFKKLTARSQLLEFVVVTDTIRVSRKSFYFSLKVNWIMRVRAWSREKDKFFVRRSKNCTRVTDDGLTINEDKIRIHRC